MCDLAGLQPLKSISDTRMHSPGGGGWDFTLFLVSLEVHGGLGQLRGALMYCIRCGESAAAIHFLLVEWKLSSKLT